MIKPPRRRTCQPHNGHNGEENAATSPRADRHHRGKQVGGEKKVNQRRFQLESRDKRNRHYRKQQRIEKNLVASAQVNAPQNVQAARCDNTGIVHHGAASGMK
jgi:hypothetical protein